jgi:dTDP-4-dehydrorhamnose 3,5-epimerase
MSVVLDDVDRRSVWLPAGVAHGYQALTHRAELSCRLYRVGASEYHAAIRYDDPDLAIPWPLPVTGLTPRDAAAPGFATVQPMLRDWFGA